MTLGSGLIGNVAELGAEAQEQLGVARPSLRMSSPLPLQHPAGAAVGSSRLQIIGLAAGQLCKAPK